MALPIYPSISGGTTNLYPGQYPLQRSRDFGTQIAEFQAGNEQRFQDRSKRDSFVLQYTAIPYSDRLNLDAFISSVLGSSGRWRFILNGTTYAACQFDDETFTWQENKDYPLHYNGSVRFRVTTQDLVPDAVPGASNNPGPFPTVAAGMRTGYPFEKSSNFQVARVDLPTANRVAYPLYGSGFPHYPTRALFSWTLTFNALADADLATLEAHYLDASGRYAAFSFVDPTDLTYYPSVRYDMDSFKVTHVKPGLNALVIKLAESFGPAWQGPALVPIFSTGVATPGVLAALGSADGHYMVSGPSGSGSPYVTREFPWSWLPNNALSQWISPGAGSNSYPGGTYTYTQYFDMDGFNPGNSLLSGQWTADDSGQMYLNGNLISLTGGFAVTKLTHFSTATGFIPGTNQLTLVVSNISGPSGVRCAVRCVSYV